MPLNQGTEFSYPGSHCRCSEDPRKIYHSSQCRSPYNRQIEASARLAKGLCVWDTVVPSSMTGRLWAGCVSVWKCMCVSHPPITGQPQPTTWGTFFTGFCKEDFYNNAKNQTLAPSLYLICMQDSVSERCESWGGHDEKSQFSEMDWSCCTGLSHIVVERCSEQSLWSLISLVCQTRFVLKDELLGLCKRDYVLPTTDQNSVAVQYNHARWQRPCTSKQWVAD